MKKTYENKGRKYQENEKATILELFQEGYTKKDIARMQERTIKSIESVVDESIRNSIIFTDEGFRRVKTIMSLVYHFARHPLAKDVVNKHKEVIQWSLMGEDEYSVDDILEFILIESQLINEEVKLQKLIRNNPGEQETPDAEEFLENSNSIIKPLGYYMFTIKGVKESIKKLKRYKDNITS